MENHEPETDELYVALTQPVMFWDVPVAYYLLNAFAVLAMLIWNTGSFLYMAWVFCLAVIIHSVGVIATEKDPHFMSVIKTYADTVKPHPNKKYWKCKSYSP